jgi:hypothetical protein
VYFRLPIADCRFGLNRFFLPEGHIKIGNWQSEIGNIKKPEPSLDLMVRVW